MKVVAVHQPNFLPWLGYFYKMSRSDVFVVLDDVDFQQGNATSLTNRTRIKGPNGVSWITIPVKHHQASKRIHDIRISDDKPWRKKILNTVYHAYGKTDYFQEFFSLFEEKLNLPESRLSDLNIRFLIWVATLSGIEANLVLSSEIGLQESSKEERIAQICQKLGATHYLSGSGARKYNRPEPFAAVGVELCYTDFVHPVYPQPFGDFVAGMSVLDAIFNLGPGFTDLFKLSRP